MSTPSSSLPEADWEDVNFDHGAAQALAGAMRQAAFWADQLAEARHHTLQWALEDAAGPWAEQLRGSVAHEARECAEIAEQLRLDAGRVEDASDLARAEQHRREGSRLDWLASTSGAAAPAGAIDLGTAD